MSYTLGEAAILTRVQACTGFNTNNAARMDWKLLNSGKSDHYAILRPGSADFVWITLRDRQDNYRTVVEVWQRYTDETTTYTNLYTHINNLLVLFTYPNMGAASTVFDSNITDWAEPEEMWNAGENGPGWLRWRMTIAW